MRPPLEIDIESKWRWNVRGPQSWELCRQAGKRKPHWSRKSKSWVVAEPTGRDLLAMAEAAGLSVVVTGQLSTAVESSAGHRRDQPEADEWSLW